MFKNLLLVSVLALDRGQIISPGDVTTQNAGYVNVSKVNVSSINDLIGILLIALRWLLGIFLALAVVMFIWAAYLYMFGAGESDKIKEATNRLKWGVVAIVVALCAGSMLLLVKYFITESPSQSSSQNNISQSSQGSQYLPSQPSQYSQQNQPQQVQPQQTQYYQQYSCNCTVSGLSGNCLTCCNNHGNDRSSKNLVCWASPTQTTPPPPGAPTTYTFP